MHSAKLWSAVFVVGVLVSSRPLFGRDSCDFASPGDPRASLVLKEVQLMENRRFQGKFELSNIGFKDTLVVDGGLVKGAFVPNQSVISIQFLDLNGRWTSLTSLIEEDITEGRLEIKPHAGASFVVDLMSQDVANESATDFRVLVRLSHPDICLVSKPFRGNPARPPVSGFEQSP
jgi:hypothetical protein